MASDGAVLPVKNYVDRMNVFSLDAGLGWMSLGADPCYWVDSLAKTHRTEIYHSGRIVITRIKSPIRLVLDKVGFSKTN